MCAHESLPTVGDLVEPCDMDDVGFGVVTRTFVDARGVEICDVHVVDEGQSYPYPRRLLQRLARSQ